MPPLSLVNNGNCLWELQNAVDHSAVLGGLNSETTHFWTGVDIIFIIYRVVSESSRTVTVVTVLVKDDERGGQSHTVTSLLHVSGA
jgi:hypothetical protein